MTALGRFISRLGDKALPFFKIMKRTGPFKWTPEAAAALEDLKRYLQSLLIMVALQPHEPLILYLAATPKKSSVVLVAEGEKQVSKNTIASLSPDPPDEERALSLGESSAGPREKNLTDPRGEIGRASCRERV